MIPLLIIAGLIYLFVRQYTGDRPERWKARVEKAKPVGRYLLADVRALRPQRRTAKVYTDEEIRRMLDL
jgi:hypothetical protein